MATRGNLRKKSGIIKSKILNSISKEDLHTVESISANTKYSKATVRKYLKNLNETGAILLEKKREFVPINDNNTHNLFPGCNVVRKIEYFYATVGVTVNGQ